MRFSPPGGNAMEILVNDRHEAAGCGDALRQAPGRVLVDRRMHDRAEFEREWIRLAQRGYAAARRRARQQRG
jgi:hypothetical protein